VREGRLPLRIFPYCAATLRLDEFPLALQLQPPPRRGLPMTRLVCAAFLTVSCGGSSSPSNATIAITSPAANDSVLLGVDAGKSVTITYALTNFTAKPAGTCGSTPNCGHIHLLIDGSACTPAGGQYNNDSGSPTTAVAKFASCPSNNQTGAHVVTLELHDDAHHPVNNAAGQIKASVTFTTHL
jgi:hypothetical protein